MLRGPLWKWMPRTEMDVSAEPVPDRHRGAASSPPARHTRVQSCAWAEIPWVTAKLLPAVDTAPGRLGAASLYLSPSLARDVLVSWGGSAEPVLRQLNYRHVENCPMKQQEANAQTACWLFFFFWSSQPIKPSSIIFLLKAFEKPAESCTIPWQFCRTESDWQATDQ